MPADWRVVGPTADLAMEWIARFCGDSLPRSEAESPDAGREELAQLVHVLGAIRFVRDLPSHLRSPEVTSRLRGMVKFAGHLTMSENSVSQALEMIEGFARTREVVVAIGPPGPVPPGDTEFDLRLAELALVSFFPMQPSSDVEVSEDEYLRRFREARESALAVHTSTSAQLAAAMAWGKVGVTAVGSHERRLKRGEMTPQVREAVNLAIEGWNKGLQHHYYLGQRLNWGRVLAEASEGTIPLIP